MYVSTPDIHSWTCPSKQKVPVQYLFSREATSAVQWRQVNKDKNQWKYCKEKNIVNASISQIFIQQEKKNNFKNDLFKSNQSVGIQDY